VATHLKVTAILFFIVGAFLICAALFMSLLFGILGGVVGAQGGDDAAIGVAVLGLTGATLTIVLLILGIPYVICGWGLWKRRRCARIMGIILAALALTKIPFGTIFGIYALIILFQKETEALLVA
jgi:hypothetical protein